MYGTFPETLQFDMNVLYSYHRNMGDHITKFPKQKFLECIASGMTEPQALAHIEFPRPTYILLLVKDHEFKEEVERAKKDRADVWHEKIVTSVDAPLEKDEVAAAKLRFEKLKYLAATDNPDKYAEKTKHQHDISINIFQEMKDLPASEAKRLLSVSDPFAIEAECTPIEDIQYKEDESLEDIL